MRRVRRRSGPILALLTCLVVLTGLAACSSPSPATSPAPTGSAGPPASGAAGATGAQPGSTAAPAGGPAGGSGPEHAGRRRAAAAGVARPAPHPGRRHDAGPAAQRRGLRPGGERGGRPEHRRAGPGGRHPGRRAAGDPVPDAVGRARHVVVQLLARPGDERRRRARRGPGGARPLPHRRRRVRGRGVAGPADPRGGAHGAGHARRPPDAAGRRVRRRRLRAGEHPLPRGVPARLRPREHPGHQRPAAGAGGRAGHPGLEAALGDDPAARRARRAGARHAARRRHQRPGLPGDGRVAQRQHQRRHRRREQPVRRTRRVAVHGAVGRSPRPARGLRGRRRCPEGEPPRGGAGGPARLAGAVRLVHRDRHRAAGCPRPISPRRCWASTTCSWARWTRSRPRDYQRAQELANQTYPQVYGFARNLADAFGATLAARMPQGGAPTGGGGMAGALVPPAAGFPPPVAAPVAAAPVPFRSVRTYQEVAPPVRLRIPALRIDTPLQRLGRAADRTVEVPADFGVAGWFAGGPAARPGRAGGDPRARRLAAAARACSSRWPGSRRGRRCRSTARTAAPSRSA